MNKIIALISFAFAGLFISRSANASIKTDSGAAVKGKINQAVSDALSFNFGLKKPVTTQANNQSIYNQLNYFKQSDFGIWTGNMNPGLLFKLDKFASLVGVQVTISPATGSIGRHLGVNNTSQHNIDEWGDVRAVDLMVPGVSMNKLFEAARQAGFHGIGLYPDWEPSQGIHVDVRENRTAKNPALWSAFRIQGVQQYFEIQRALA